MLDAAQFHRKMGGGHLSSGNFVKDTQLLLYCGRSSYIYYGSSVVFVRLPAIRASKPRRMKFTTSYSSGLWVEKIYNLVPISASRLPCFAIHLYKHLRVFPAILCSNKKFPNFSIENYFESIEIRMEESDSERYLSSSELRKEMDVGRRGKRQTNNEKELEGYAIL